MDLKFMGIFSKKVKPSQNAYAVVTGAGSGIGAATARGLAAVGRRMPVAPERYVRLRDPRPCARLPVPRARPAGGEAAPPCPAVRRLARLRVGTEGVAAPSVAAAGAQSCGGRGLSRAGLCPR